MTTKPKPRTVLLSIAEAAEMFGVQNITIGRWIKSGKLKATKINNRRVLIRLDDIEAMLADNPAVTP
jgi:excisionase family DNA binding protein